MKHTSIWIGIGALVVIGAIIVTRTHRNAVTQLPPAEPVLAGPQEPIPQPTYDVKPPVSKNRTFMKNTMNIEVTKEGTGPEIKNGSIAVVQYIGTFENGTVFDASANHSKDGFSFHLGAGEVIKGWDQGVVGMKVGETRILTIPGDLAYGPNGIPGAIPPNATLVFEVTLLAIK